MKNHPCRFIVIFIGILTATQILSADDLLPVNRPIVEVIDHYVAQKLSAAKVRPAPRADDATLVRRLYLDLAGRIPTPVEARDYVESKDAKKHEKLVEHLLASPEFVRHNANEFDALLANDNAEAGSVRAYLLEAFRENRAWDQMFQELVGGVEKSRSANNPEKYVSNRLKDRDSLTRDISSVFFGLNITCAQCHKHPYISSLTQDYFFGMREFFATSYEIQGNLVERKFVKVADFKAKSGKTVPIKMMFLDGSVVERETEKTAELDKAIAEETKAIQQFTKNFAKTKELPPVPPLRARAKLAEVALSEKNRDRFAQAIVNRLWYRFYGHGLVMRVDQLHAKNPASHPELLSWLARDLISHRYDLKRLIAGLVSSETYARSSTWPDYTMPARELFAVAHLRPLTPMQWSMSFGLANNPTLLKSGQNVEAREKALAGLEKSAQGMAKLFEYPREGMQISTGEAMWLSNDPGIQKSIGSGLVPSLMKIKDRKEQITEAVWTVLSRPARESELELFDNYLEKRKERPASALQHVLWAMINGAEFRFNH
ncbi:MAG: DUF1549 domain-containing protein [Planctomycetia bacterium]|nr:DUF1549 domain-containing protein [Planctomycetia bacterium]